MDDDVLVRAITIGASVFITLATVTAVLMYYNTARAGVRSLGTGTNIEENYREDIKTVLYNSVVTGSDIKNILQYFCDNIDVNIIMPSYYAFSGNSYQKINVPAAEANKVNASTNSSYTQILKTIMPNERFNVTSSGNNYTFTLITVAP